MRRWAAIGLLLLGPTRLCMASELYPRVQVVARLEGAIFDDISKPGLADLVRDLQEQVRKGTTSSFKCMEWVTEMGSRADSRAHLFVVLTQRKDDISTIDLSLSGAVKGSQPVTLWTALAVASSLNWSPRNVQGLKDKVDPAITVLFMQQELRRKLDTDFIANIPIAERIEVDARDHRVIVPVSAKRLNLEPETLLKLTLTASLCPLKHEKCSRMGLVSEGAGKGIHDPLRCRIESLDCCVPDWSPGFAVRLERAKKNVKVYLSGSHRHCQFGPDNCPGPDGLYRHRGTYP